jgi:hypothetical protein
LAGQGETFAKLLQDTAKGDIDKTIDLNNLIAEFDWNNLFAPEAFIQELEKLNIVLDEEGK